MHLPGRPGRHTATPLHGELAFDTLVEVLKSLILGINLVALVALNLAFPLMWSLKFQEVPVLYVLLA